jgi:hypothetical protein
VAGIVLGVAIASFVLPAGEPGGDLGAPPSYDEVIRDLVGNLGRDPATAQDAATKLARLGKRAVPVLTQLLKDNYTPPAAAEEKATPNARGNPQLAFYAVVALAQARSAEAAKALLPLLQNDKASPELRNVALGAQGLESLPESAAVLQKIAASDPDIQLRRKAYGQLSVVPNFWLASEKLFLEALADADDEVRTIASKQCWYARVYYSAVGKLIELAEKDSVQNVRINAMLALTRMAAAEPGRSRVRKAVPAMLRIYTSGDTPAPVQLQALRTLCGITGVSLKDAKAVETWWEKFGRKEYEKLEAPSQDGAPPTPQPPEPPKAQP